MAVLLFLFMFLNKFITLAIQVKLIAK